MDNCTDHGWQAILLPQSDLSANHGDVVSIGDDAQVVVIDQLAHQREELAELMHDCPQALYDEASMWVYFPWRHCVLRLLGENAFKRLRSDRNRNKITAVEQRSLCGKTIAVIGLSVGYSIAYTIAQEGLCGKLLLVDYDELSLSNLNRVPCGTTDIGLPKTVALARRIAELDPYLNVEIVQQGVTTENIDELVEAADLVVDECDSIDIKFALRFTARKLQVPVIMQTSDGGVLDIERYDLEPDRPVFHGLTTVSNISELAGLSNAEKVPQVMAILEADKITARLAASLLEIDVQVSTWPQLASDVSLGAGMAGVAVRRWALGQDLPSGRLRLDMDQQLQDISSPAVPVPPVVEQDTTAKPVSFSDCIVHAASRAPSGGNAQPWRFEVASNGLDICLDPSRSSTMDIKYRGSLLAIGAAMLNAEVSGAAASRSAERSICADRMSKAQREGREPVAKLHFGDGGNRSLLPLSEMIDKRTCVRKQGKSTPINAAWIVTAKQHAKHAGAEAVFLQDDNLKQAADIWAEADRIRFLTPNLHREMFSELKFPGDSLTTGIDVRTLELNNKDAEGLKVTRRSDTMRELAAWGGGKKLGDYSKNAILDSDALLVLTAAGNSDSDYVNAGCTLQRIWLEATRDEVGLQPLSPLFLYATSPSDLVGRVAPADVKRMWDLRIALADLCGFKPEQALALTLRATSLTGASVRSQREPLNARSYSTKVEKSTVAS